MTRSPANCAEACGGRHPTMARRRLLAGAMSLAGLAAVPWPLRAAEPGKRYDAMLLNCMDPRLVADVHAYMDGRGLRSRYSQFVIAGGPAAVALDAFKHWHQAFWDNLALTIGLHGITRLVALAHRDCGAVKAALGAAAVAEPDAEAVAQRKILAEFRARVAARHPALTVETGVMALDGTVRLMA
jgi:hypothetical protein